MTVKVPPRTESTHPPSTDEPHFPFILTSKSHPDRLSDALGSHEPPRGKAQSNEIPPSVFSPESSKSSLLQPLSSPINVESVSSRGFDEQVEQAISISAEESTDPDHEDLMLMDFPISLETLIEWWKSPLCEESINKEYSLKSTILQRPLSIHLSAESDVSLIAKFSFPLLLKHLSAATIVKFYTACLFEISVVLVSKHPGVLSALVMSAIPLIYPMVWQGPLIPILPSSFYECLDCPVPTITGLLQLPEDRQSWSDCLIIDADSDTIISLPRQSLEKIPNMPKLYPSLLSSSFLSSSLSLESILSLSLFSICRAPLLNSAVVLFLWFHPERA